MTEKQVILKDQHIITTARIHNQLKELEIKTCEREACAGHIKKKTIHRTIKSVMEKGERIAQADSDSIGV
jgi:hypothetical protein